MAEYYLIAQLPSLDGLGDNMPIPITEERFLELCSRFLGKKAQDELGRISLVPSKDGEKTGSKLLKAWNERERSLRFALGKIRAEKMKKQFDTQDRIFPEELLQTARTAVEMESPMEAETFLNQYRLDFLETLRPVDTFALDYVFYYWIKLKLLLRIRQFDADEGRAAYNSIYRSIMSKDKQEVMQ
ncbi:MAG TPA: DUF2764 domain-containing protein [Candidatus Bariatricus faecipullorum]|nr:DUF2764 domain-containing protein [Candidatus Bariatricus faecipullorum]